MEEEPARQGEPMSDMPNSDELRDIGWRLVDVLYRIKDHAKWMEDAKDDPDSYRSEIKDFAYDLRGLAADLNKL